VHLWVIVHGRGRESFVAEKSELLGQLRIDRTEEPAGGGGRWLWWLGAAVLAVAVGAAWWFLSGAASTVVVRAAVAEPIAAQGATSRGSVLDASGYVVARRQATVSAKITGKVVAVLIEEGQRVEQSEVIARLDDANARAALAQAEAQRAQSLAALGAARVAFENSEPIFERNQQQFARQIISAQSFDAAKAEYDAARTSLAVAERAVEVAAATLGVVQRTLDDTVVRAPFAGVVTVKAAQEGEMISPNSAGGGFTRTGIGTIVDMDSLEVEVDVSENFINRVQPGQDVTIKLNAYPDWDIPGHVIATIPTADRAKATVKVRVGLDERDERVLPDMGVRVSFLTGESDGSGTPAAQPAVLVPPEAVQADGDSGFVFVIRDDSLERRAVRLGARASAGQTILAGIAPGTRVAVGDLAVLADGLRVRVEN
jgi:RND family efflux transporter MFP subunit